MLIFITCHRIARSRTKRSENINNRGAGLEIIMYYYDFVVIYAIRRSVSFRRASMHLINCHHRYYIIIVTDFKGCQFFTFSVAIMH